jgi:hypothetical protein
MKLPLKLGILAVAVILLLAGAAYAAVTLANPNANLFQLPGLAGDPNAKKPNSQFTVNYAADFPRTNPDIVGPLVTKQDNSLMVRPASKTENPDAPLTEIVLTQDTKLVRNATGDHLSGVPAPGAIVQQVLEPYPLAQVAVGDNVIAWGQRRGERLIADFVMVETVGQ